MGVFDDVVEAMAGGCAGGGRTVARAEEDAHLRVALAVLEELVDVEVAGELSTLWFECFDFFVQFFVSLFCGGSRAFLCV